MRERECEEKHSERERERGGGEKRDKRAKIQSKRDVGRGERKETEREKNPGTA